MQLYHLKCEQQYITMVSTADAHGRTVLHYASTAKGVMVETVLHHNAHRFREATTSDIVHPIIPLFPSDGWISPVTGELWQPEYFEFPEDHPEQVPPPGFISTEELCRARRERVFIDSKDGNNATPLHYATVSNDVRAIRCLLEYGAETFSVTKQGATCLDLSANRTVRRTLVPVENAVQLSCGIKMLRPGVKTPSLSQTAGSIGFSRTATFRGQNKREDPFGHEEADGATTVAMRKSAAETALVFLVNSGEDINGRTGIKLRAPLHVAAEQGATDVVQLLLSNGAIVDILDVNGCTPLHLAAELGTEKHMAVVELLYNAGANANATNSVRKTPLHMSAAGGPHFSSGENLIPKDAEAQSSSQHDNDDADDEDGAGKVGGTADGNTAMITLLVKLGSNLEAADLEGNTPLIAAAKRGNHLGVQTLLTLGARIYAQNIRGHTALHMSAFLHQLPVVRQLVRWDAEVGKLKFVLDTSGRSAYDMAADPPTRDALHTLWESCASGKLDMAQAVQRQAALLPPTAAAPWLPCRVWETTRVLGRTALHCTVTGAAKAMAIMRSEHAANAGKPISVAAALAAAGGGSGTSGNKVAAALSKAVKQRREREAHVDSAKGTGLPRHKVSPSAVHILAGVGFRFVSDGSASNPATLPAQPYMNWNGNHGDVHLTFPEPLDPLAVQQEVDRNAFVPRPGAHLAFVPKSILQDAARSEAAAQRAKNGTELTSSQTEKEFGRIVDFLLRSGVDVNAQDADGVTALMLAVKYGLLFIIRKLLSKGADPMMVDSVGNTAMHYAYAFKQAASAEMLTEFTVDETTGAGSSTLDQVPNGAGRLAREVPGQGIMIHPDTHERLVYVPRLPKKSRSLEVTGSL